MTKTTNNDLYTRQQTLMWYKSSGCCIIDQTNSPPRPLFVHYCPFQNLQEFNRFCLPLVQKLTDGNCRKGRKDTTKPDVTRDPEVWPGYLSANAFCKINAMGTFFSNRQLCLQSKWLTITEITDVMQKRIFPQSLFCSVDGRIELRVQTQRPNAVYGKVDRLHYWSSTEVSSVTIWLDHLL